MTSSARWPKTRSLQSYLDELEAAVEAEQVINYRVARPPSWDAIAQRPRCYIVHDGAVRGYNWILYVEYRGEGEVARVKNDAFAGFWPASTYIVRDPQWYPVEPVPMRGFQGWRWYEYPGA